MTNDTDRSAVAIVGFSFRLPGGSGEALWQALLAGRDLVSCVDADRWDQESMLHPDKAEPGTAYTFAAGSVGDVAGFDAGFFGISPREAEQMDPQQRVLLELTWEAFEQAGITPSSMRGSRCGVYVGLSSVDYAYRRADDLGAIDSTTMTGGAGSIAANRISYVFDLHGPSMVLDTACSSSLVAFHQACQSIRTGESDTALVGGISLHLHPYGFIGFSKASMLSRRGHCSVFDAAADGYVRSEGGGIIILKPLIQALADGNRILGLVAATGVNSDGRKLGLTVPSHTAQAALLRDVYGRAGIAPAEIDYFEAHGTGTTVGDPLETRAIGEALGQLRSPDLPLPIGSVKGNIGHLEAAAGMAGLVKVLHVLRDRVVPPNIHLTVANPAIDLTELNLAPVTEPYHLPSDRRLVIGVSAFGFGGTNAHAVLTSFEPAEAWARTEVVPTESTLTAPLLLSARSPEALRAAAADLARHMRTREEVPIHDIIYSLTKHRDIHSHRLAARGTDRENLAVGLEQFANTGAARHITIGRHRPAASPPAFVYSGNGSQWAGMGLHLLEEDAVFREAVIEVDALYTGLSGDSILAELRAPADQNRFTLTEVAQPALFAVQVGLTRLLEHHGVRPIAVCGHSVGEVAAAWASGALSLDQAVRVIHARSAHQARTRSQGCMTAVTLPRADAETLLHNLNLASRLEVVAINSAHNITLAGDLAAMIRVESAFAQRRVVFQRLALDYAFHSAAMDPIRDDLLASLRGLAPRPITIPMYSTVTGELMAAADLGADYWWRNVRELVNLEASVRAVADAGVNTFIEIGPRSVLRNYLAEITKPWGALVEVLASLTRQDSGRARVQSLVTQLELGGALPASGVVPLPGRYVDLPHYPWQREHYWHATTPESGGRLARRLEHPLLGYELAGETLRWENHLDVTKLPVYADHAVGTGAVLPAAGFVEMALAAGRARRRHEHRAEDLPQVIEDLEILAPLVLDANRSRTVRLALDAHDGGFTIISRERAEGGAWQTHATGRLVEECVIAGSASIQLPARVADVSSSEHYEFTRSVGLNYGPAFRTVAGVWYRREGLLGSITTPAEIVLDTATTLLHPAYLDGAFQLLAAMSLREQQTPAGRRTGMPAFLPVRIARLELHQPHAQVTAALAAVAAPKRRTRRSLRADFTLYDAAGDTVAVARGVRFRAVSVRSAAPPAPHWIGARAVPMPRRDAAALALPDSAELARRCAARLHTPQRLAARKRFAMEIEPLLDALCASLAARAVHALTGDQPIDLQALVATGRLAASSAPMLQNLLQMLGEDGLAQRIGDQWLWRTDANLPAHEDIWSSLIADYPEYGSLTSRVGAAGVHLAEHLRSGGDERAHADSGSDSRSAWVDGCTQKEAADVAETLADVIRHAAAAQPPPARLRVLRVLGSTPAEGLVLLPSLDTDGCDLVIGAASQAVLDEVLGRWPAATAIPCHLLDLDGLTASSAILGGGFDLVVLGEGLADAADPLRRLLNARALLLDGGRLVLLEQHPSRAADLVFGLATQWWRGDMPVRSRFCTPETWTALLARAGFDSIELVRDIPDMPTGPYLMFAHADVALRMLPVATAARHTWLILRDCAGFSAELGKVLTRELEARGQLVVTVLTGADYERTGSHGFALDPHDPAQWDRLLADLATVGEEPHGLVHLAGLDLATAGAPVADRALAQESRAGVLVTWLQTCTRHAIGVDTWAIGAQAGTTLLPTAARSTADGVPFADPLRDAALWGIARVAMNEYRDRRIRWVDLCDPADGLNAAKLAEELLSPDAEDEILLTATGRYAPRFAPAAPPALRAAATEDTVRPWVQLDCSVPGSFRNLRWHAAAETETLGDDQVDIEVHAAGLNFRDVMYAMGLLPDEAVVDGFCGPSLGMEVSGVVTAVGRTVAEIAVGDAVIAFAPASFGNRVRTRSLAVTRKPAAWSFAAAATVPTAFFTAYYALHEIARLRAGERVLIHCGAGGVGIAAIQLAKQLGAEIFVTAGTAEKRDFMRLLGTDHVFDSRSMAFADEVLQATAGEGVDVVLNSLAGEAISRNLRLLRPFGRMLELGKRDFYENSQIGLRPFRNNISYFGIDVDQLLARRPDTARRVFVDLMALFASGTLQPLPHRTFDAADIASAFRHMQASRHIGKVVVTFGRDFAPLGLDCAQPPPLAIRADATYLVSGGLSGLGLRTAQWLAERGARHLALLSRRGAAATPEAQEALAELMARGVSVIAPACDVSDPGMLGEALNLIFTTSPPLGGVVHAAMVIEDALLRDLNPAQLKRVLAPKLRGALHLHEATRALPLDFFVLYSSATAVFGNPGQAAYVAANLSLEALADERRSLGLPVTCVGWGPIADTGYLARNPDTLDAITARMGGNALRTDEVFAALETALAAPQANRAFLDLDGTTLLHSLPGGGAPKFSDLARLGGGTNRRGRAGRSAQELRRWLTHLPTTEMLSELTTLLRAEASEILRIAPERIDIAVSLIDMGMDSLMAVELAASIESRLDVRLSALALNANPSIQNIVDRILRLLQPSEGITEAAAGDLATRVSLVASQHAGEFSVDEAANMADAIGTGAADAPSLTRAAQG
ncbi:MAG: type I polyketide synthase [Steroidobacteraceae bacterium]